MTEETYAKEAQKETHATEIHTKAVHTDTAHSEFAPLDQARVRTVVREFLLAIGEDPTREGLLETPDRVARAYAGRPGCPSA